MQMAIYQNMISNRKKKLSMYRSIESKSQVFPSYYNQNNNNLISILIGGHWSKTLLADCIRTLKLDNRNLLNHLFRERKNSLVDHYGNIPLDK